MYRLNLSLATVLLAGCGLSLNPFDRSDRHLQNEGEDEQEADAGSTSWEVGERTDSGVQTPPSTATDPAEDDQPMALPDADEIIAMPREAHPERPCGQGDVIRYGWDAEGRLQILDYVLADEAPPDATTNLESRQVFYYDDSGRLTDWLYLEGISGVVNRRAWFRWEDELPVEGWRDGSIKREPSFDTHYAIDASDEPWTVTSSSGTQEYLQDREGLTLVRTELDRYHGDPSGWNQREVYHLFRPVEPIEVLPMFRDQFHYFGPIDSLDRHFSTVNDRTNETTQQVETIDYTHHMDGRLDGIGDAQFLYDCAQP